MGKRFQPAFAAAPHSGPLNIDVTEFGARGDGETDDAPAINAAIAEARRLRPRVHGVGLGCRIAFPAGAYLVRSTLDFTNLRDLNTIIDGQGSALIGCSSGAPVIDALGSRWLTMHDLTIIGDREAMPSIGLQIGVAASGTVADDHRFENIKFAGHFGLACLYNRGAETTEFDHLLLWNDQPGGHCLIQDGCNHFDIRSAFAIDHIAKDAELSFNENFFVNCDFRHGGGGTPVWLGDTTRHAFVRCYAASGGEPCFLLHCGTNGHTMLDVDCHCETFGLQDVFCFSSSLTATTVRGFSYRDHACYAEHTVFTADKPIEISIENARIDITTYRSPAVRLFAEHVSFAVAGNYYSTSRHGWNGDDIFNGRAWFGRSLETFGAAARAGWGDRQQRPDLQGGHSIGQLYFDHSVGKLLIWSGAVWLDSSGRPQ